MPRLSLDCLRAADLGGLERLARSLGMKAERKGTPREWRKYVIGYIRRAEKRVR